MNWLDTPVFIDEASAAVIAAGMRAVALADGDLHKRELALIESFEKAITPSGAGKPLREGALAEIYLRSLVLVALADGVVSEAEKRVIVNLVESHGVSPDDVDQSILDAKREFLKTFAGVRAFRDDAEAIGKDLDLPTEEIAEILDGE